MRNTRTYFDLAQLAEASYADLISDSDLSNAVRNTTVMTEAFSLKQATELAARWAVTAHQPNTESGFSSTLFHNTDDEDGEYVLAIRGTKGVWNDLLLTDIADIVTDGIAINQTIDLYNEWRRLTAIGTYQAAYLDVLADETAAYQLARVGQFVPVFGLSADAFIATLRARNDIIIDDPSGRVMTIKYTSSTTLYDDDRATGLGLGAEIAAHGLTVTGHSLGGHLATAFTRLFSGVGADAVTINGAGFAAGAISGLAGNASVNIRNLFLMLNGENEFGGTPILNLYGDKNLEFVTMNGPGLYQQGAHKAIFIEQDAVFQDALGHGAAQMTDSLAVYDLFQTLQSELNGEFQIEALGTLKTIFETGTRFASRSLESLVNSMSDALNVGTRIPDSGMDDREALYSAIYAIRESEPFGNLSCKLNFVEMEPNSNEGRTDFAHFLSLYYLLPFKMETSDGAVAEQLRSLHRSLGDAWQQDNMLTESQRAQGFANFSDKFLEDRAFLLDTLFRMNLKDRDYGDLSEKIKFTVLGPDASDVLTFNGDSAGYPNDPGMFDADRARYVFGSDSADDSSVILASGNDDHLYGMAGNDSIKGLAGADYLEGGTGNDLLQGNQSADALVGGAGNDDLVGGRDDDYLLGGFGADNSYWFNGDGSDVIGDYDDAGDRIIVNYIDLATLNFKRRSVDSPFYVDQTHPEITLHYDGGQLTIDIGSGPNAGSITVTQYTPATDADFGIELVDYNPEPNPSTNVVVAMLGTSNLASANQTRWHAFDRLSFNQRGVDWASATITFIAGNVPNYSGGGLHGTYGGAFEGGPVNDYLVGNLTQNALHGLAGDDRIEGGAGNDFVEAGAGSDLVFGGDGADILFGSARVGLANLLAEPSQYDQFYLPQISDSDNDSNILAGDAGDDFVVGGEYADYMAGGAGLDYLLGGTGADYISGGVDRDIIYGDSTLEYRYVELTPGVATERLEIAFADGSDDVGQYDDVVHAGSGDDSVWGELGDDELYGESGDDNLFGDRFYHSAYFAAELPAYDDTAPELGVAVHGNDKLHGGAGADLLLGLGGADQLAGGTENDNLLGGAGDDLYIFYAGDGRDWIEDTEGNHTLMFIGISLGDLRVKFKGDQVFVGSDGPEEGFYLSRSQWAKVRIALDTPDAIVERSRLDTQYFDGAGNLLLTIHGVNTATEAGRDNLMTVDTTDPQRPKLVIRSGVDEVKLEGISAGAEGGRIRVITNGVEFVVELTALQLEAGNDFLSLAEGQVLNISGFTGVVPGGNCSEWIAGSGSADVIRSYGGNDVIDGGGGSDEIDGGSGYDMMFGGDGDDALYGGQISLESDYFDGGRGSDVFYGGAGSDTYRFVAGDGTDRINDNNGFHSFDFGPGVNPAAVRLYFTDTTYSRFRLEYGNGDAIVSADGASSYWIGNVSVGGIATPLVQRSDLLNGTFRDTQWHDVFEPGTGTDIIHIGGWGNDVFRFGRGDGQDVVKVGQDLINLSRKGEIRFAAGVDLNATTFSFLNADAIINYGTGDRVTLDTATVTSHQDNTLVRFTLASEENPDWIPVIHAQGGSGRHYGTYGKDHIVGGNGFSSILPGYGDDLIEMGDDVDWIILNDLYIPEAPAGIGHKDIHGQGGDDTVIAPLFQGLTFHYQRGDGNDTIVYDWSYTSRHPYLFNVDWEASTAAFLPYGEDTLAFGGDIALADLRFTRFGDSLAIQLRDGSGMIRVDDFFSAWDAERGPQASSNLFALMSDSYHPDVETLLHPGVLAALPRAPIAHLAFADGSVFSMATVLDDQLEFSNATVFGTEGNDEIRGTQADDVIHTFGGDDDIEVTDGNNAIDAGAGDDRIVVTGSNIVDAGSGDDVIEATGNNVIRAGSGDDRLVLTGHNILQFGPGDDFDTARFTVRAGVDSTIVEMAEGLTVADVRVYKNIEDGADVLSLSLSATGDLLSLHAIVADPDGSGYTPHPHATVTEVRFSDGTVIAGEALFGMVQPPPNVIEGTAGNDWLEGTENDDDFYGGAGNDVMYGAAGIDFFYIEGHNDGADRIMGGEDFDVIYAGDGDDTITLLAMSATDSIEEIDGGLGMNSISGTKNNNVFNFSATQLVDIHHIDGRAGNDDIRGSQGDDVIVGGLGDDTLRGMRGNDLYMFGRRHGRDSIANYAPASADTDTLWIYDVSYEDLWFSPSGWDLLVDVVGTNDQVRISNWYFSEDRQLDAIYASDRVLQRNQVDQLVNAMAAFDAPTGAGAVVPQSVQNALEPTLTAVWHLAA